MTQEDDFIFKPKELALPVVIEEEPDTIDRAIHFRIVNTGSSKGEIEMDTYFEIEEHLPTHTLSNVNKFSPSPLPDAITFYLDSKRLTNSVPLRILPRSIEHPVLIYTSCMPASEYSSRQLKQHFNLLYLPLKQLDIVLQKIEFEREKLRKLKEVYLISMDKTKNPRFLLRDFLEYIKKVMCLQLNVTKMKMDEKVVIREEGLVTGVVEAMIF